MATATQRERLRADIGADETSLPDADADDIYTEAGERYTDADSIDAYARVVAIRRLMASAARETDYTAGESSEKASQVFAQLRALLPVWEAALNDAVLSASTSGAARFGGMRRKPKRIREYPGS